MSEKEEEEFGSAPASSEDEDVLIAQRQAEELSRLQGEDRETGKEPGNEGQSREPSAQTLGNDQVGSSPLEMMADKIAKEGRKQSRTSLLPQNLTVSLLQQPSNLQEPNALAEEGRRKSNTAPTTIDVDEISSQEKGGVRKTLSNVSVSSSHSNTLPDGTVSPSALELVAQQAAKTQRKSGLAGNQKARTQSFASQKSSAELKRPSLTTPATEEITSSAKRLSLTRDEPALLAGDERRRSSSLISVPSIVGRTSSGGERRASNMSVDVDDILEQQQAQEPKPAIVNRSASTESNASSNTPSRSSLLVGPGSQEFAQLREETQANDKRKAGHMRFNTLAAASSNTSERRTSSLSAVSTERQSSTASSVNPAGMDDSVTHRSHRSREEFEAKRQALATSPAAASQVMVASMQLTTPLPMMMEVDASHPMVRSTNKITAKAGRPARPLHNSNTHHAPAKHIVETTTSPTLLEATETASAEPNIHNYRAVPPPHHPSLGIQGRGLSREQLVEATLVREDSTSNNTDTEKGEGTTAIDNPVPETAPPPPIEPPPPDEPMNVDLIVQAHPAKVTDAAEDLIRNRHGRGLVCLIVFLIVVVVGGVAYGVISSTNKKDSATKVLEPSDLDLSTPQPTTLTPTQAPEAQMTSPPTAPAPVGSLAPTTAYEGYVVNLLPNYTLPSLTDPDSPQSKALNWLVRDHMDIHLANLTDARLLQRFALATLYFSSNGIGWRWARYWLATNDLSVSECDWWSYYDLPGHDQPESVCDEAGLLVRLALNENYLRGTLPKELALLTQLTEISLVADGFFVTDGNKRDKVLSGTLPVEWMKGLTNLKQLDLSRNALSGAIPTEIGLMTSLKKLKLLENNLDSELPSELFQLTNLKELWLYDNKLRGALPTEIGLVSSAGRLDTLVAFKNNLAGLMPSELGLLTQMTQLKLEENRLTGTIPIEITNLRELRFLQLTNNKLSGTIHTEFGRLTQIQEFWMGKNRLTGTIPPELGGMERAINVGLSSNQLTGTIPSELGRLGLITRVVLDNNNLNGTAPTELCERKHTNPIFFRVFVDCDEVDCGCWCCWCDCFRNNGTNGTEP